MEESKNELYEAKLYFKSKISNIICKLFISIQMYKSVNGFESFDWHTGPQFIESQRSTRAATSNSKRMRTDGFKARQANDFCHFVNVRHNFFLNRVTRHWNKLNDSQILATSVNSFKSRIDSIRSETAATA